MPTNRCPICLTNWPQSDKYAVCPNPACEGESTSPISNVKALPKTEAKSLAAHMKFDAFYEKWDDEHDSERLSTDTLSATLSEPEKQPSTP